MCTQDELAIAVGVEQAAISQFLKRANIDIKDMPISAAIIAYCNRLRETAANRQDGLAEARAKTEVLKQEMLRFQIAEKSRSLVSAEDFRAAFVPMMKSFRTNILSVPAQIVREAKALKGIDLEHEFIEDIVYEALEKCSETDVERLVDAVIDAGAGNETAPAYDNDRMGDHLQAAQ